MQLVFPTTFTPQGDGNSDFCACASSASCISDYLYPARGRKPDHGEKISKLTREFPTTFTPQGDGNKGMGRVFHPTTANFRLPLPRKGTETAKTHQINPQSIFYRISDYLYPARGRKPSIKAIVIAPTDLYFRLPLPRKGTETDFATSEIVLTTTISDYLYPARGRKLSGCHT